MVLSDYGVSAKAILSDAFYNSRGVGLVQHLEQVIKSGQEAETKYKLPRLPQFLRKRLSNKNNFSSVDSDQFTFCVSRFLQVICQFISGFPAHLDFRYPINAML